MTTAEPKTAATVAEQGAKSAPKKGKPNNVATRGKNAPKRASAAGAGKKKVRATGKATKPVSARDGSKKANVLALLERKDGATLAELMKATGWQAHSVRGFLSGALGKKVGLKVTSAKEDGQRTYSVKA